MRLCIAFASLLLVHPSTVFAQTLNDAPSSLDAIRVEPFAGDPGGPIMNTFDAVAPAQSYFLERRIDHNNTGAPGYTLSQLRDDLRRGYGLWGVASHGSPSGFGVEVYLSQTACNTAFAAYIATGQYTNTDIWVGSVSAGSFNAWSICVTQQFLYNNFYSWQSFVYDASCFGNAYGLGWRNARAAIGYAGTCPATEQSLVFRRMNGEFGAAFRPLFNAIQGTPLVASSASNLNTVLSPIVSLSTVPATLEHRQKCVVTFDCPMDMSIPASSIVAVTYPFELYWPHWISSTQIEFTLIGRHISSGVVSVVAYDHFNGVFDGARTESGQIPLDGDGRGPNRDSWQRTVVSNYVDDDPAASVTGFAVEPTEAGVVVRWHADGFQTARFLVERGPGWNGPFSLAAEMPAKSSGAYEVNLQAASHSAYRLSEVETDGDTLIHFTEWPTAPSEKGPDELVLGNVDSTCAALLAGHELLPSARATTPEYFIYTPAAFHRMAEYLCDAWTVYKGVPTAVVELESIGGATGIKPHVAANLPDGGYVLLMGDGNEEASVDGRLMRANLALYDKGFVRDAWPSQPTLNLIPAFYTVETDSQRIAMSYWTPFRGSDWWFVDFDNDGVPDPAYAIGRAPVSDTTEAWGFVWKTVQAMFQPTNPLATEMSPVDFWCYARDYATNSGDYVKQLADSLQTLARGYNLYLPLRSLYTTDANPLTAAQRDAAAKSALDDGRSLVVILSTVAQRYHLGAYLHADLGFDVNSLLATGRPTFVLGASCGIGDFDRTENPAFGTPIMERLLFVPGRGMYGFFGANRGTFQVSDYRIAREFLRLQYATLPGTSPPTVGLLTAETVRNIVANSPLDSAVVKEFVLLGDPHLVIPTPAPPRLSVIEDPHHPLTVRPNPSRGQVLFSFYVAARSPVSLEIFDIQGRSVATPLKTSLVEGSRMLAWSGTNELGHELPRGIYLARLRVGQRQWLEKIAMLR